MRDEMPRAEDGTQPAEPSSAFADPLAGMLSGDHGDPTRPDRGSAPRPVAGPVAPDPETVRRLLEDVFAARPGSASSNSAGSNGDNSDGDGSSSDDTGRDDSEPQAESRNAANATEPAGPAWAAAQAPAAAPAPATQAVDTAEAEGAPVTPVDRQSGEQRPGMLPLQRRTWPTRRRLTRRAWRPRVAWRPRRRAPARRSRDSAQMPRSLKPSRGAAGVAIAVALLVLFCLVAIEFVASLLNMFSGIAG